jgi:hypothetical protein
VSGGNARRTGRIEVISRFAALPVLFATPFACTAPAAKQTVATSSATGDAAPRGPVNVHAELKELMRRSADLKACTATYRASGYLDETIRITYAAPDRVRFDTSQTTHGRREDDTIWIVGNRYAVCSERGDERQCADVAALSTIGEDCKAVLSAARSAFPSHQDGDVAADFGAGVWVHFWLTPDANVPEEGSLDLLGSWMECRDYIFHWLLLASSLPVLRDDGERIFGEDPTSHLFVVISKSNGFIERITGATEKVELVDWVPTAEEVAFTIPPPAPGSKDFSEDYRHMLSSICVGQLDDSITQAAVESRRRDSIEDDEFSARLASVYDIMNRRLRRDEITKLRDLMKKAGDDAVDLYRRQLSAAASDPDFRGIAEQWIAKQRSAIGEMATKASIDWIESVPPPIARDHGTPALPETDPRAAELIEQARRRSAVSYFESEIKQPALAYFDEQVAAVRSKN